MPSMRRAALALVCGACLLSAGQAQAEVSFKGKTIEVILGSTAGGGTDGTTRLVGSFLEKYLPGNPSMRYRNLPGTFATRCAPRGTRQPSAANASRKPFSEKRCAIDQVRGVLSATPGTERSKTSSEFSGTS